MGLLVGIATLSLSTLERAEGVRLTTGVASMLPSRIDGCLRARVYDLEQPRFAGMASHPTHVPGYLYTLHRRHEDTYNPEENGPRSGASGVLVMMEHSG